MSTNNRRNSSWLEDKYRLEELQKQVHKLQAKQTVDHLMDIVPDEAFIKDGKVDLHAKNQEISDILSKGYPNDFINDKLLIRLYSDVLRSKEIEHRHQQRMAEMKERTETAERLRTQFPPTFKDKHNTVVIT